MKNILIQKFDEVISLGEDCACASYLKKNHLRFQSYPFDWLTNASLKTRLELVINNFADFMNIDDLKLMDKASLGHPSTDSNFDYYHNLKNDFYFFHDFKANILLKKTYDEVKKKFDKRINIFLKKLRQDKKILLVWLSHTKLNDNQMIIDKIEEINKKFSSKIYFLVIENTQQNNENAEYINISSNILRVKIETHNFSTNSDPTLGIYDNCQQIFRQIRLKNYWVKRIYFKIFKILKKNKFVI